MVMFGLGVQELLILAILAIMGLIMILPFWRIFSKAGFSGWLSLTQVIPILNYVVLFYFAFAEWPVHRELESVRRGSQGHVT